MLWLCPHCDVRVDNPSARGGHVVCCAMNSKRRTTAIPNTEKETIVYTCARDGCDVTFEFTLTRKQHANKKRKKYCTRHCANNRELTVKQCEALKLGPLSPRIKKVKKPKKKISCVCVVCNITFEHSNRRMTCEKKCLKVLQQRGGLKSAQAQSKTRRSKSEIYLAELCKSHFMNVTTNDAIFEGWDADILVHDYKLAILWNGPWHYRKITRKHSVKQVKNRDRIKLIKIAEAGWHCHVIKDSIGKFSKQLINKEFDTIVDLTRGWSKSGS